MSPPTRFAIVTDTHYVTSPDRGDSTLWNKQLLTRSGELGEALAKACKAQGLDFIIHCGDLTHYGDPESFKFAREIFSACEAPLFFTLGNHDLASEDSREQIGAIFRMEQPVFSFSRLIEGLRLIFLDTCIGHQPGEVERRSLDWEKPELYLGVGPSRKELSWLKHELVSDEKTPTILVCHHPFHGRSSYPKRLPREPSDPAARVAPLDPKLFPYFAAELRDIARNTKNLCAVVAGHWHMNDRFQENGVHFIQTASLIEYPFEFRIVEFVSGRLDFSMAALDVPHLNESSYVTEWNNRWISGELDSREFSIALESSG